MTTYRYMCHKIEIQSSYYIYKSHEITHYNASMGETPSCFSKREQQLSKLMILQTLTRRTNTPSDNHVSGVLIVEHWFPCSSHGPWQPTTLYFTTLLFRMLAICCEEHIFFHIALIWNLLLKIDWPSLDYQLDYFEGWWRLGPKNSGESFGLLIF